MSLVSAPAGQAEAACTWTKTAWEMPANTNYGWLVGTNGKYAVGGTGYWQGGPNITNRRGALWENGKLVLQGVEKPNLYDVNASGLVVGQDIIASKWVGVKVARDGSATVLPSNPAWESFSADLVNNAGDIVGTADVGTRETVVVWPASAPGTYRELSTPDVSSLTLVDVDEQGRIVVDTDSSTGGFVRDTDGQWRKLAAPGPGGYGTPQAIRDGRVVGDVHDSNSYAAAEWNAQGALVRTIRNGALSAKAIGGKGTVGGQRYVGTTRRPVLWRDGVVVDQLATVSEFFTVHGISDDERTLVGSEGMPAHYTCTL